MTDKNPRWAVTPPRHYCSRQHICKSEVCKGGRKGFCSRDWSILGTPNSVALEEEGFDQYYALRSCLRTRDESSGLADMVEGLCDICTEGTKILKGRIVVVDCNPLYTLGMIPLDLEKRHGCLSCLEEGRNSSRFVPKENTYCVGNTVLRTSDWTYRKPASVESNQ